MKKISNLFTIILAVAVCVGVVASGASAMNVGDGVTVNIENFYEASSEGRLGGEIHNVLESFDAGIAVNGTTVIDSSGNYDGSITSDTGTFSSTLAVTGESQLSTLIHGGLVKQVDLADGTTDLLTAAEMCNYSGIIYTTEGADATITVASTTDLIADCLDTDGDRKSITFQNASLFATTTTLSANTDGDDIQFQVLVGDGVFASTSSVTLDMFRASSTEIIMYIKEAADA